MGGLERLGKSSVGESAASVSGMNQIAQQEQAQGSAGGSGPAPSAPLSPQARAAAVRMNTTRTISFGTTGENRQWFWFCSLSAFFSAP